MRPREQSRGQDDLFRSRLDQIIDMRHELVRLGGLVDWRVIGDRLGEVYSDGPGQPPLPTRLMAGLAILKHTFNLSDEELVARWVENPYFQHFCGEEHFRHKAPFDRSSMTRWRQRMGEERLEVLLQESLAVAVKTEAIEVKDLSKVIVDTTVQEKAITFPTDAKLLNRVSIGARDAGQARQDARARAASGLPQGRQVGADQISTLRPRQTVEPRPPRAAPPQDNPGSRDPRRRAPGANITVAGDDLPTQALPGGARACAKARPAGPEGLFDPCARGRMHRQRQGAQTL